MSAPADTAPRPVVVLGRGRVGRSLAAALAAAGRAPRLETARRWRPPAGLSGDAVVLLAVPDGAVASVAGAMAGLDGLPAGLGFAHLSGALGLEALGSLAARGHPVGSFHPLQPFPVERPPSAFRDILVAVDASDDGLLEALGALALDLGARPRRVRDAERACYHAAAAMAANLLVALADQSCLVLQSTGWTAADAIDAVRSLMQGSLDALGALGLPEAQSGPVRRGDAATVARHVDALAGIRAPGARAGPLDVYRPLSLAAIDVAVRCGLDDDSATRVERALGAAPVPGPEGGARQ